MRRGHSIVELLAAIFVIGVLVSLAAPLLAVSREAGRNTASLSNLRSHLGSLAAYAGENDDVFPRFTDPGTKTTLLSHADLVYEARYFDMHFLWAFVMADAYYAGIWPHESQARPGGEHFCSYYYSATLIADPAFWSARTRTGPEQWRAVRMSQTVFPSSKAAFTEIEPIWPVPSADPRAPVNLGLIDGSASSFGRSDLTLPYPSGEGEWTGAAFHVGMYGMHTIDGVRGRDVR